MTPQYRYARPYGTRVLSVRVLVGVIPIMAVGVPVGVVVGVTSPLFVVAEVAAIGGMLLQDRLAMLWARVGDDEKHVCAAGHGRGPRGPAPTGRSAEGRPDGAHGLP